MDCYCKRISEKNTSKFAVFILCSITRICLGMLFVAAEWMQSADESRKKRKAYPLLKDVYNCIWIELTNNATTLGHDKANEHDNARRGGDGGIAIGEGGDNSQGERGLRLEHVQAVDNVCLLFWCLYKSHKNNVVGEYTNADKKSASRGLEKLTLNATCRQGCRKTFDIFLLKAWPRGLSLSTCIGCIVTEGEFCHCRFSRLQKRTKKKMG